MDKLVQCFAHFGHMHQFTDLGGSQVIVTLPWEFLLLNSLDYLHGDFLELAKWTHGQPPVV